MHSKRTTLPINTPSSGDEGDRQAGRPGLSGELGSALMDFARRLANFGLGEMDGPILDEFVERRRQPRLLR
jgi:hypothetical protein